MILVNFDGFGIVDRADEFDFEHIVDASGRHPLYRRYINNGHVKGLFETSNPTEYATVIQQRIHIIAFINEDRRKWRAVFNGDTFFFCNKVLIDQNPAIKTCLSKNLPPLCASRSQIYLL